MSSLFLRFIQVCHDDLAFAGGDGSHHLPGHKKWLRVIWQECLLEIFVHMKSQNCHVIQIFNSGIGRQVRAIKAEALEAEVIASVAAQSVLYASAKILGEKYLLLKLELRTLKGIDFDSYG